jgi:hypothetical protein
LAIAAREITQGMATAAAAPYCAYCHGFGSRPLRFGKSVTCNCVLRGVFRACMRRYEEVTEMVGQTCGKVCLEVYQGHAKVALGYGNKNAEYRADVELTALRVLTADELALFKLHFLAGIDWHGCCRKLKLDRGNFFHKVYVVERKMGRALAEAGVYPSRTYFGGVFLETGQVGMYHVMGRAA